MKVHVCVILANGFPPTTPFFESFALLQQYVLQGLGNDLLPVGRKIGAMRLTVEKNFPIDWARNHACGLFLDHDDSDYLLFLDADMTHPPDLAHRLVRHDVDVVTGRYVMRKPPFFTVAMRKVGAEATEYQAIEKLEASVHGLLKVDAAGAGALLISRRCLEAIRARVGDDWFRYQDGPEGKRSRSEDMWFYEQARAAGFQPWLDADLRCGHQAVFTVDDRNHAPYADEYKQALARVAYQEEVAS